MKEETCALCDAVGNHKKIIDVPDVYLKETYAIHQCPACGVGKAVGLPKISSDIYGDGAYQLSEKRVLIRYLKRYLHRIEIRRLIKSGVSQFFLDVGCGSGDLARYLFESGFSVAAADAAFHRPSDLMDYPEIEYLHFDYETLIIDKPELIMGKTVILRHVLEHIRDPKKLIQRFIEWGASYIYILVPNSSCLLRKIFGKYETMWGLPYHIWHFNKKSLKTFCGTRGLNIINDGYETIPAFLYSLNRYLEAKQASGLLRKLFKPSTYKLILSLPLDVLSLWNVIYLLCEVRTIDSSPEGNTLIIPLQK